MQKPTIAIIGPGRAGSALGRALRSAGYSIAAIGGRNPDNVRNLADELGARACQSPATTIDLADLTILAVPDDVIGDGEDGEIGEIDRGGRALAGASAELVRSEEHTSELQPLAY